jgi:hypothetical protein
MDRRMLHCDVNMRCMHLSKNREHHEQTKQNCRVIDATDFSQSDLTTADPEINSYL